MTNVLIVMLVGVHMQFISFLLSILLTLFFFINKVKKMTDTYNPLCFHVMEGMGTELEHNS